MSLEYRFDHRVNAELQPAAHKRSLCWLYFILFVLLQLCFVVWLYLSGYLTPVDAKGGVQALSLRGKVEEQERLLAKQADEIARLEARVATVQRSESIQTTSNEVLRDKLVLAETELAESRERLLLYEEVLAPPAVKRGLNVQYLDIKRSLIDAEGKKLAHDRRYQYHLILTNVRGAEALVKGRFDLTLSGEQQGKPLSLPLKDLALTASKGKQAASADNTFAFKHYQGLEGAIELPDDFKPRQITIELIPEMGKKVRRQYAWDAFVSVKKITTSKE